MALSFDLRCHKCNRWIGEARQAMELVGLFENPRDRTRIAQPRDTWQCGACGWANVFRAVASRIGRAEIEVKQTA